MNSNDCSFADMWLLFCRNFFFLLSNALIKIQMIITVAVGQLSLMRWTKKKWVFITIEPYDDLSNGSFIQFDRFDELINPRSKQFLDIVSYRLEWFISIFETILIHICLEPNLWDQPKEMSMENFIISIMKIFFLPSLFIFMISIQLGKRTEWLVLMCNQW